jgi:hypothetical protein
MNTLERQLADYGDGQRELHGPITPDELIARGSLAAAPDTGVDSDQSGTGERRGSDLTVSDLRGPVEPAAPMSPKRRTIVAAAVAAALVVAVGIVVADSNDDSNVVTDAISSASSPEPVRSPSTVDPVVPATATDALGHRWSRVLHDEVIVDRPPFNSSGIIDVTVGGPGLVAVGEVGEVGEVDAGVAVWTSVDGITWSRVPHDEAVFGGADRMQSVTTGGPGLVAVGGARDDHDDHDDQGAVVWTSVDGVTWSRVPHDETVFGGAGEQTMASVTAGGPGLVAVGSDASDAAVWTSVDGITWSRVPHQPAVFGGEGGQTMESVTVGGPGLVAVGVDGFLAVDRGQSANWKTDFLGSAAVWTSVDGTSWSRVPDDDAVFGGEGNQWMDDVTAAGPGLVAVGGDWLREGDGAAAVWTSVDGVTWSRVPRDAAVFGGENDQAMNSVTSTGSGLVAVGRAWAQSGEDSAASVWTSVDGITWSWMGYNEEVFGGPARSQFMTSVIATDSVVAAVGADGSLPSRGAPIWIASLED